MSDRFADSARRLAGHAGRLLGWPPPWFWRATPAELAAILHEDSGGTGTGMGPGMQRADLDRLMAKDREGISNG